MQARRDTHPNGADAPLRVTTLIPVKPLASGKSRLSEDLDLANRTQLTHDSLRRIVRVLQSASNVERIVVISRDDQVIGWAKGWGTEHLREGQPGLNAALREARMRFRSAAAILVIPSDLVAVTATDVQVMIDGAIASTGARSVVIAPDRHGLGTNALLLRPPDAIDFEFGANSAERHAALARERGIDPVWYRSDSISLDLDSPDDLDLYWNQW